MTEAEKIESRKLSFREGARARTDHGADIISWPASGGSPHHPPRSVSLNDSLSSASFLRSPPALASLSLPGQGGIGASAGHRT
ncbi:hypothetical protein ANANG_G00087770 [Anguilla anguilla]|uniref:Uncharacterized protein n=1 Tax=Anguilla anguilla TaxID=7936 RepID=A0A9D3S3N4_ANGAN|nr:hypothetical protein ANANG_G00087770 [Anguilla anguilla]